MAAITPSGREIGSAGDKKGCMSSLMYVLNDPNSLATLSLNCTERNGSLYRLLNFSNSSEVIFSPTKFLNPSRQRFTFRCHSERSILELYLLYMRLSSFW